MKRNLQILMPDATDFQPDVFQSNVFQVQSFSIFQPNVFQHNVFQVEDILPPVEQGGGGFYAEIRQRFLVFGIGYGILPKLEGEGFGIVGVAGWGLSKAARISCAADGVLGTVGKSAAQFKPLYAIAIGHRGQVGTAAAIFKNLSIVSKGAVGACGSGSGMMANMKANAIGQFNDHELAAISLLLAA
jgi:hypothetical protein